jgi:hypothetical protein
LERQVDFMTLHTGMKFEIPFDELVIFCTNIEPKSLVDEAFLRRIRYKINIGYPTEREFEEIFTRVCENKGIPFDREVFGFLREQHYRRLGIKPNACHPRDLGLTLILNGQGKFLPLIRTKLAGTIFPWHSPGLKKNNNIKSFHQLRQIIFRHKPCRQM